MRFIAHRGNLSGPEPERENQLEYLAAALAGGYDVECDVLLSGGALWLGHDRPTQRVELQFLQNRRVWTHAKTAETLLSLARYKDVNAFFQADDALAVTTRGFFWNHSACSVAAARSVRTVIGFEPELVADAPALHGLCSDYVALYRDQWPVAPAAEAGCPFRLLILDIDGVLTDGTKLYGPDGAVLGKSYCDQDFTAIKRFKAAGVQVCFLSGDRTVNETMARTRKVDFFFSRDSTGNIDKARFVPLLAERYAVAPAQMAYVGDDYYDLSIIENLQHTYCPSDAIQCIQERVHKVLPCAGGHGVVAALYDLYRAHVQFAFPVDSYEVNTPQV